MLTIACSSCQKKLSVSEDLAGKKVKCPGCSQVTTVPSQAGVKVGNEEQRAVPPASNPDAPPNTDASNSPTDPPLSNPDATVGITSDGSQDPSLGDFLAPPQASDELGRLGPYRVLKILGEGGMGKVFLAEDPDLQRSVALKVMNTSVAKNATARQRFLREARLAAKIEHDHIVQIYQVGEDRGVPFLAMQLLKGASLEELLVRSGALKIKQVLRIGIQIAQGLAAAHEHGMIHRDIKPGNIWIEPIGGGRVKILDFGLARTGKGETGLTQSGVILGTPAYMPPEQARGENVDHRCDLYSLGCVLYRMATGALPLKGNDTMSMLMALATTEPEPPTKLNPDMPQALGDLIMKLLAKDPTKRVATAKEVVQALKAIERAASAMPSDSAQITAAPTPPVAEVLMAFPVAPTITTSAATVPSRPTTPRRPGLTAQIARRPIVALATVAVLASICLLSGILFGGQVFRIVTNQGRLAIEVKDPNVQVKIVQNGVVVYDKTSKREFTLTAAKGEIEVLEKDGVKLMTKQFELTRGGKITVTVTLEELAAARQTKHSGKFVDDDWLKRVAGLPPAEQVKAVSDKLQDCNQFFDGKLTHVIAGPLVTELTFLADNVTDLSALRALTGLRTLRCNSTKGRGQLIDLAPLKDLSLLEVQCAWAKVADLAPLQNMQLTSLDITGTMVAELAPLKDMKLTSLKCGTTKVSDLAPLKDMKLTSLDISVTNVANLTPLKDMKLTNLVCVNTKVTNLAPLKDMKLTSLDLTDTKVSDLTPLKDMKTLTELNISLTLVSELASLKALKLTNLNCHKTKVSELAALKDMKLTHLICDSTPVADLTPLTGMPLTNLNCANTKVASLAPLTGMPLKDLRCDFKKERDADILRPIKTLTAINGKAAAAFWKEVDASMPVVALPRPGEWVELFNGKDLTNWQGLVSVKQRALMTKQEYETAVKAANAAILPHWKVDKGILVYDGKGDNLQTVRDYGDIEMFVDWKIAKGGDTGIFLRGNPQVQIWDNPEGSGGLYNNRNHANKPLKKADRPVGEWNTFRILMRGERVTIYLNGELVVDDTPLENYWERNKPLPARGPIELQHFGDPLWFRNIRIRELVDGKGPELPAKKGRDSGLQQDAGND